MTDTKYTQQQYRDAIGLFATGITVLIAENKGEVRCMTANAISSLSLDPVQLIVCPSKNSTFASILEPGVNFTVNILGIHQEQVSNYFAGPQDNNKTEINHYDSLFSAPFKAPRLKDCIASFACQLKHQYDGGDHWIVVGKVVDIYKKPEEVKPLLYFGGQYHHPSDVSKPHLETKVDPYK